MSEKELAQHIIRLVGGKENIASVQHCATRLRIVVHDKDKINVKEVENLDKVKGSFFNAGQYQIILGTGLVNRVYDEAMTQLNLAAESPVPEDTTSKPVYGNKFQRAIRMFSDVFVPIIPVLVATGLFMGLRGLLTQEAVLGVFGMTPDDIPNQLLLFTQILTDTAFAFLPALVCWSTFKNFGGSPVIGIVLGLMLVSNSLPSAYDVGSGAAEPLVFFGFIKVAGYQGSVLPAFATGVLTAKFEKWLRKRVPDAIDLIVTPFVTLVVGIVLALFVLGPILHTVENVVLYAVEGLLTLPLALAVCSTAVLVSCSASSASITSSTSSKSACWQTTAGTTSTRSAPAAMSHRPVQFWQSPSRHSLPRPSRLHTPPACPHCSASPNPLSSVSTCAS